MTEEKKEFFSLVAYIKGQKKKVGYAYKTKGGGIAVKADDMLDASQLGRLLKKGLYIEKRSKLASQQEDEPEYTSAIDDYE
jgi:hypothetical protein